MDVTPAIVLLTGMYVTGTYGGAFTSILFRIPGEPIHVPLLWDGYAMARKGQPAKALGWTLYAALIGGLLSAVVMVTLSEPVAKFALTFSTPEYFAIVFFGLTSVVSLARGGGEQCLHQPVSGAVDFHRGSRLDLRHAALCLRLSHPDGRHRVSHRDGGRLRGGRGARPAR